jgi:hypothetical protein
LPLRCLIALGGCHCLVGVEARPCRVAPAHRGLAMARTAATTMGDGEYRQLEDAMSKWWWRLRLILTGVVIIPSVILLMFAYLSATSPGHSAREAIVLLCLAIALPPLVYGLGTAAIWLKRGQAPDADPTTLSARIGKKPYIAFVPIVIMLGLIWLLNDLSVGLKHEDEIPDGFAKMRESCVSESLKSAKQNGADPNAKDVRAMVSNYCSCIVLKVQIEYTPAEFAKLDSAGVAQDKKFNSLLERCEKESSQQ